MPATTHDEDGHHAEPPADILPVNILIVDDDPRNLMVLETLLAGPDYRIVRAGSGDEALLALMSEQFAVLVLDVQMPGMTGFELAQIIKQRRRTASIPIIFLTAYFNDDHAVESYETGAVDYLRKPVDATVLRSKVAVFAELHRKTLRLVQEVAVRRAAEEKLTALNATLDQRVLERTAALAEREAMLREANAKKDEFLATLAHELRNPLAPIRNAANIVQARCQGSPDVQQASAIIDRQVRAMGRLIEDLMDVSRINQGRFELRRAVIDVRDAIAEAVEVVQPLVREYAHQLVVEHASEPLPVDADRARLAQAVVNLLSNAAKYTEPGGRICLAARRDGGQLVVCVTDTGIGIPPHRLEKIFDMFSQEEAALARSRGGLGIGLALTQRLVGMHGGAIVARSEGPGRGSEFEIRLPLAASLPAAQEQASGASAPDASLRILIADDNADAADSLGTLLEIMGHSILRVHDGEAAVDAVARFDPQLVLLDIGMPKLNGYEACQRIRTLPAGKDATIAALTGWGQPEDLGRSRAAGFDHHLVKPVEMQALSQLLHQAAARLP